MILASIATSFCCFLRWDTRDWFRGNWNVVDSQLRGSSVIQVREMGRGEAALDRERRRSVRWGEAVLLKKTGTVAMSKKKAPRSTSPEDQDEAMPVASSAVGEDEVADRVACNPRLDHELVVDCLKFSSSSPKL